MTEENEAKKKYLLGYQKVAIQVRRAEDNIRELRYNAMCPSLFYDDMPHAHNTEQDLSGYMAKLSKAEAKC